jgi:tRNA threonylcarbamoyladenosine biosynthesis protein TsaB
MIVLGFDTATSSTTVGLRLDDVGTFVARDDPSPDERPGHMTRLLALTNDLLATAKMDWSEIERIAVGLGPGTFTGLRVGVATARGLAQTLGVDLVGVSSLRALAEPALWSELNSTHMLAVLDARRGEAFAAAYELTGKGSIEERVAPHALAPEDLGNILAKAEVQREGEGEGPQSGGEHGGGWCAVGDGAVRFREDLERAGLAVPQDSSPLHLVDAETICELGARAVVSEIETATVVPDYRRRPDAEIALEARQATGPQIRESEGP